jgi:PGF-CTERM protein
MRARGAVLGVLLLVVGACAPAVAASPAVSSAPTLADANESLQSLDLRTISYGQERRGAIDQGDPEDSAYRGYYEPVTFRGQAGDSVAIDMGSAGDTYLYLVAPDGTVVAENDDSGNSLNSSIFGYTLQQTGEYTIVAGSYGDGETLEYTLSLSQIRQSEDIRQITYGETVYGEIDQSDPDESQYNGYHEPVTFRGYTGDVISVSMQSTGDTYLYLVAPDGTVVAEDDDGGSGLNSALREVRLNQTGQYTVVATSFYADATFSYSLAVEASVSNAPAEDEEEDEDDDDDSGGSGPGFGVVAALVALLALAGVAGRRRD